MGQARQRKEEINQLKAQTLESVAAFYHADQDVGFSIGFNNKQIDKLQDFTDTITKYAVGYLDQIGKCVEWPTKEALINDLTRQTEDEIIPWLNNHFYNQPIQPTKGRRMVEVDLSNNELMKAISVFFMNVTFLEFIGALKGDDYNGMLYMHNLK